MKLKKFAALALAGVMAVSMLAGCATKEPADSTPTETTSIASQVVSALSKKDELAKTNKVAVSESASLKNNLDKVTKTLGAAANTGDVTNALVGVDTSLSVDALPYVYSAANKELKKTSEVAKVVGVVEAPNNGNYSEAYVVNTLVNKILDMSVWTSASSGTKGKLSSAMPTKSGEYTTVSGGVSGDSYMYNFTYTMEIAVSEVKNELNGTTNYMAAFVLVRTPAKAAYEA